MPTGGGWTLRAFEIGDDAQVRMLSDDVTESLAGDPFGRDRTPNA